MRRRGLREPLPPRLGEPAGDGRSDVPVALGGFRVLAAERDADPFFRRPAISDPQRGNILGNDLDPPRPWANPLGFARREAIDESTRPQHR